LDQQKQSGNKAKGKTLRTILIGIAVLVCYFFSEAVLRQFVLHRAGSQSTISLSSVLGKLPPGIRDEVTRRITIAEYKDELKKAKTLPEKIRISIALAGTISPQRLQEKYAELIDKYPDLPDTLPAYVNFLRAPDSALKSISIARYHEYISKLKKQNRLWAWSSGFAKLKSLNVAMSEQLFYLKPLLNIKPDCREYAELYKELTELAFEEEKQDIELNAKKLEEQCEKLPFFDEELARKAKAKARKIARQKKIAAQKAAKAKAAKAKAAKAKAAKDVETKKINN
jgi:hypothetical protein